MPPDANLCHPCACVSQDPVDVPDTPLDEAEDLVPTILERDGVYVAGEPFPCLGALANDLSGAMVGPFMEGEPIDAFAEALEHEILEAAPEEDAAAEEDASESPASGAVEF